MGLFKFGKNKKETAENHLTKHAHPTDFEELFDKATHHVEALQTAHRDNWGLGRADRYDVDLETGYIRFIFDGDKIATAAVTLIGTWSANAKEFLWGWDHPMCPPADNSAAVAVKTYANVHGIDLLQYRALICEEDDGWGLAAIACLLGELKGVYRCPKDDNYVYLGFENITLNSIA